MHNPATRFGRLLLSLFVTGAAAVAAAAPTVDASAATASDSSAKTDLSQLVETIVREAIPKTFEDTRHWGKRRKVANGLDIETKGLRLRISKRERAMRHGLWRRFRVTLLNPHETLQLRIENLRSPAAGQFRWDLYVRARVNVDARFEHWNLGVKLLNGSADADATLEVHADCSVKIHVETDGDDKAPVVVLRPTVHKIGLRLPDLDVNHFGTVRGRVAREVGSGFEDVIEDLLQTQEKPIRNKAQKSIDKHADDFRIPLADVLSSPWAALLWGL